MSDPLQLAIAEACLGEHAGDLVARDLPGFLASQGVDPADVEAVRDAPARLAVYRTLVRNGLSGVVARMLARTRARLNRACDGRFDADFAAFVDRVGPRTHYLRDVPSELVAWASPQWRADVGVPRYLPDLADYELASFGVAACASGREPAPARDIALDRPLAFVESARLLSYDWAVHELAADPDALDEPAARPVRLLAYRDASHAARWLELSPLAATLAGRLVAGEPLRDAVEQACAALETSPAAVHADVARLLADLGERGVVLGAA